MGKGTDSFIAMLYERLVLMHDLLADTEYFCSLRLAGHGTYLKRTG
jgi:hypothetical protein